MRLRPVIVGLALSLTLYAVAITVVIVAKGHASRGTFGISMGAR